MEKRALLLIIVILLTACRPAPTPEGIRIGSKNFAEQLFLGELLAAHLEQSLPGTPIIRKFGFGSTTIAHEALVRGEIDLYVEYSGTAAQVLLKLPPETPVTSEILDREYRQRFHAAWMPSLGFNNSYVLVMRESSPKTLSAVAPLAPNLKAGLNAEFVGRPDGYPALQKTYGLKFKEIVLLDVGLIYDALHYQKVDIIGAFGTDGRLSQPGLQVLEDDRHCFPRYEAAPVVRLEALQQYPDLQIALKELTGKLSIDAMRKINKRIELDHESPATVAREIVKSF